VCVTKFTH